MRVLVLLGAAYVVSDIVACDDAPALAFIRPPALASYVQPAGLQPVAVPAQTTGELPAVMMSPVPGEQPFIPGARMPMPVAPSAPMVAPSVVNPVPFRMTQLAPPSQQFMERAPQAKPHAVELSETGPLLFSGFFAGLASSFAIGFIITAKRMYDGMQSSVDTLDSAVRGLELGVHPTRAGVPTMLFGGGVPKDEDGEQPTKKPGFMEQMKQAQQMFNPDMMKKYGEIGTKLQALQTELAQTEIECQTAEGGVTVTISGAQVPVSVTVSDDLCAKGSDAVSAELTKAFKEAHTRSGGYAADKMKEMYEELGLPTGPGMAPPPGPP